MVFSLVLMVWYLLVVQLFEAVDFPFALPVGDLSKFVKGKQERVEQKEKGKRDELRSEKSN